MVGVFLFSETLETKETKEKSQTRNTKYKLGFERLLMETLQSIGYRSSDHIMLSTKPY